MGNTTTNGIELDPDLMKQAKPVHQDPSIEIKNLHLSFGSVEVLKDLNLEIGKGEFLVLLGSSGCGKSTLLNCIAGLLDVTDGQINIGGRNVTWEEPSDRGIGMVFQSYALYPQMSVEGNLSFGLRNAGVPKAEIAERVARAAKTLQIEPLLKRKPAALSGGQRQRIGIARALYKQASVLILDEATSSVDNKTESIIVESLRQHTRNLTVIIISHELTSLKYCDRIIELSKGKLVEKNYNFK